MLRLVVDAGGRQRHYPMRTEALRLGSSDDNDIVVKAVGVSRHHAMLRLVDGTVRVTDLDSKNGMILGGGRVREAVVTPGMIVCLGEAAIRLEEVSTSDADLALRFATSSSSSLGFPGVSSTGEIHGRERERGPAAALRWARKAESGRSTRQEMLDSARGLIGADALVFFSRPAEDIALLELSGEATGQQLAALAEASSMIQGITPRFAVGWLIVPNAEIWTGARLSEPAAHSAWRQEFLSFAASSIFGGTAGAPVASTIERPLQLPAEIVVGSSAASQRLFDQLRQVARSHLDVLVTGETGTGKEVVARALHANGYTPDGPFIAVNCAALAADILEAELFGIERAVATGVAARPGLFAEADGGTIFLDEISEMPEALQAKLLRVLQEREVLPVGSARSRKIDVRVISSTNRDLPSLVESGRFRKDLYFRIRGSQIEVPALRERREDIAALVFALTTRAAGRARKKIAGLTRKAFAHLLSYDWPGNVRELQHAIEHAVLVCPNGAAIQDEFLPIAGNASAEPRKQESTPARSAGTLRDAERTAIIRALAESGGNKTRAAALLGITRAALYLKLRRFGLG